MKSLICGIFYYCELLTSLLHGNFLQPLTDLDKCLKCFRTSGNTHSLSWCSTHSYHQTAQHFSIFNFKLRKFLFKTYIKKKKEEALPTRSKLSTGMQSQSKRELGLRQLCTWRVTLYMLSLRPRRVKSASFSSGKVIR